MGFLRCFEIHHSQKTNLWEKKHSMTSKFKSAPKSSKVPCIRFSDFSKEFSVFMMV